MSKSSENRIVWYEPTSNRRRPYATMSADGILSFGVDMRDKLSHIVKIGFLPDECSLCVKANAERGFILTVNGTVKVPEVAIQLRRVGIELPAHFLFVEEEQDSLWKGYIVPPPRRPRPQAAKKPSSLTEYPHLLSAYKWLIDKAVHMCAKTMPMDERRATAQAALWEALYNYTPIHGTLKDYLFDEIKKQLVDKNKLYTRQSKYNTISLDAPINKSDEAGATGHDILWNRYTSDMTSVDKKIDMEIFRYQWIDERERSVLNMLLDGYTVEEIQKDCGLTGQELDTVCRNIGSRWETFNQADSAA